MFEELKFCTLKRGRPVSLANIPGTKLYHGSRPVTKEKQQDMQDLLPYIPPINHEYYKNLRTTDSAEDVGPFDADDTSDFE